MSSTVRKINEAISRFIINNSNTGQNFKALTGQDLSDTLYGKKG